jgi:Protein-disulfide isomerase
MSRALLALFATATGLLIAQQRAVEGNPSSRVRVIIYEDLQCSDCARFRTMLDQTLLPRFGGEVAFEHRDFPLARHLWAKRAAATARFFDEQNPKLGVEFRRATLANIANISEATFDQHVESFARTHAVDAAAAKAAQRDSRLVKLVEQDLEEGVARGIARTPTVLVDGQAFVEPSTPDEISKALETAVKRSKQ